MTLRQALRVSLYIGVFSFCLGCSQQATKTSDEVTPIENSPFFHLQDPSLGERIVVTSDALQYSGDLATGIVEIQNTYFKTLTVQYRYAWYGDDGVELNLESKGWKPLVLSPNAIHTFKTTAPSGAAKTYKIFLK